MRPKLSQCEYMKFGMDRSINDCDAAYHTNEKSKMVAMTAILDFGSTPKKSGSIYPASTPTLGQRLLQRQLRWPNGFVSSDPLLGGGPTMAWPEGHR